MADFLLPAMRLCVGMHRAVEKLEIMMIAPTKKKIKTDKEKTERIVKKIKN